MDACNRRSIPACAGEPERGTARPSSARVYPRVCGGTCQKRIKSTSAAGLSPRVRGNPDRVGRPEGWPGSIPACAGEPSAIWWPACRRRVYPRVCGGTTPWGRRRKCSACLSPRVRGNHRSQTPFQAVRGSIPACAGEPHPDSTIEDQAGVYPRVCGGTRGTRRATRRWQGLSPRVRGNLRCGTPAAAAPGSIPACAGEPCGRWGSTEAKRVYPRVCGGTIDNRLSHIDDQGLSPRVRGNRDAERERAAVVGSIPACAGEPSTTALRIKKPRVYPRVCGGTRPTLVPGRSAWGLSPRVRGNLASIVINPWSGGSIPACAGEPSRVPHGSRVGRVYPRVCGGTVPGTGTGVLKRGLSPRVRGNRRGPATAASLSGSIPACAGEPCRRSWRGSSSRVYPRVCGGTTGRPARILPRCGLSPRVRGNPPSAALRRAARGSIPACAGEPRAWRSAP